MFMAVSHWPSLWASRGWLITETLCGVCGMEEDSQEQDYMVGHEISLGRNDGALCQVGCAVGQRTVRGCPFQNLLYGTTAP